MDQVDYVMWSLMDRFLRDLAHIKSSAALIQPNVLHFFYVRLWTLTRCKQRWAVSKNFHDVIP